MLLTKRTNQPRQGFTLVELAIVLAVTGVLFLGLFRLLSGGNTQLKDTSVASQQTQLLNAIRGFLASANGQNYLGVSGAVGSAANFALPLPTVAPDGATNATCKASYGGAAPAASFYLQGLCDTLPSGFSSATINAYGQTFSVRVLTPSLTGASTAPTTYSFMIVTTGGDTIPDADGGRISSQIGSDGGFIYSTNICGAPVGSWACGSYGAWSTNVTLAAANGGFGFGGTSSGHVASRTYVSPETSSTDDWLARRSHGDTTVSGATSPPYATMQWDMFMGGKNLWMAGNNNAVPPYSPVTPTGTIHMQGSTINLEAGLLTDVETNGGSILLDTLHNTGSQYLNGSSFITLNPRCTADQQAAGGTVVYHGDCVAAIQINGDANVLGQFYAASFIYQTNAGNSDIRLKKDVKEIPSSLNKVMRLRPVSYAFKSNGEKSLGFIAQDIEKIYPDLVVEGVGGMKAVKYDALIAPLVSSVQELKRENDDLRQQVRDQIERQNKLEQMLEKKAN